MRAGVQPGEAAAHGLHIQLALLKVGLVHAGDFQLAPGTGFHDLGNVNHLLVVKVQASDGVVALWGLGLFFDADGLALGVELHHAVTLRVLHVVGEHGCAAGLCIGRLEQGLEIVTVVDVIAQHQSAGMGANERFPDEESLCQPVGAGLHGVLQVHAPLRAVTQQLLETGCVLRRADDEHIAHACQHERAERVVDHGLVVHRQQLLADGQRGWVQPGAGASGEDDAFALSHAFVSLSHYKIS
ncbi:hypothetical protein FERRO_01060 [Ferrovum sp. JA12]|nr:hypothetical protein FERRO_01060 [Ferrovum sp. JA12]